MKFLSLVIALLIEQVRPLRQGNRAYLWFIRYAMSLEHHFNGGHYRQGMLAWALAVLPPAVVAFAVSLLLRHVSLPLAWAWDVAVLYLTMGFRQFSHYFTEIMRALREGRLDAARADLERWRGASADGWDSSEIACAAIELGLAGSHRYVFGTIACFVVLGPAGAVLYRAAALLAEKWGARSDPEFGEFGRFAGRFFFWLDWLPARLTAASFAIVGNFEDAVYCWRTQTPPSGAQAQDVILASGAGAIGVRLGDAPLPDGGPQSRPEVGAGDPADVDYMQSTVGLIWRALVLWMFLLLLITIAHALG